MEVLFERPLLIVILGSVTAVLLGAAWVQTARRGLLIATFVTIAATAVLLCVEHLVETDREQITETLHAVADAVERNDIEGALVYADPETPWIRQQALTELPQYVFHRITIKPDLEIDIQPDKDPPLATARFHVMVVLSDRAGWLQESRIPRYVVVSFKKIDDQWLVYDYEHSTPRQGWLRQPDQQREFGRSQN